MEPAVQRVFVNPAIKKAMCRSEKGQWWMGKVRPTAQHNYHFHIRLLCPQGIFLREQRIFAPRFPGNAELFLNSVFYLAKMEPMIAISPAASLIKTG